MKTFKQHLEEASKYIVSQNPHDKKWYVMGHVGRNKWMPVSDGFKKEAQARKWAKSQDKVDSAARGEIGGIDEKTEYYLDPSQDNTEHYVAFDGSTWYTGKMGIRGEDMFLKFVATRGKNSYFENTKLKKITSKQLEKEINLSGGVDLKKLYKR